MHMEYTRAEAKDWARRTWFGCTNVVMPTFTSDLTGLNEKAIIHDIKRSSELGFWGSLLVSECNTTTEEMIQFVQVAAANRPREDYRLVLHGSFGTSQELVHVAQEAEKAGLDALLLSYPPSFYPKSSDEIVAFTHSIAEQTNLAMILFAVPTWDFGRLDVTGFPMDALEKMTDIDTVVALKYECGHPGSGGMVEIQRRIKGKVLIADPLEQNAPGWIDAYGMPWMGTSNYEYYGDAVPKWHRLMTAGQWEEAMPLFWQFHPARIAKSGLMASVSGAKLIHRAAWKYMQWLQGFNGGPLRMPQMRVDAKSMKLYRDSLVRSGSHPTDDPDELFFEGRNPR